MLLSPVLSPIKTFEITPAAWEVTTFDPVVDIPTSEGTRYGRTLEASDFPAFSHPPTSVKYIERENVSGSNLSGASVTIYWASYENSELVASGNQSVAANTYFTADCCFFDPVIGNAYEVAVWGSSQSGVTLTHLSSHVAPTRICPTDKPMYDVTNVYTWDTAPSLGSGAATYSRECIYSVEAPITTSPQTFYYGTRMAASVNGHNISRYGRGDFNTMNSGSVLTTGTASYSPRVGFSQIPKITYREILL